MVTINKLALITLCLLCGSNALATSYQLSFGGQTDIGTYSGYFVLDYSAPDSDPDDLGAGRYSGLVTSLNFSINGIDYASLDGGFEFGFVGNNLVFGDIFAVASVVSSEPGVEGLFGIQFQNLAGTVWDSDSLPTELDFSQFDPFSPSNSNSTGAVIQIDGIDGVGFYALDFAELHPVPLPAGLLLFMSAIAAAFRVRPERCPAV